MEENTFLDYNPQFNGNFGNGIPVEDPNRANYLGARNSGIEDDAIKRWFNPGMAEAAQFDKENFFMDKENAFNEYMFNKANEYNSESARMERMKEAGINPNLAAAGIAGIGGNTAIPMQGANGTATINPHTINPIEQLGNLATITTQAGELLNFGAKPRAEIKELKENAKKIAQEAKFTRKQRIQLEGIGEILIENARLEGHQYEANIDQIKELTNLYKQQQESVKQDVLLKEAQTGTELQVMKSKEYENFRNEFEKRFRDLFGVELTHGQMQMLVEACMNGKGENIVAFLTDTIASVFKGLKHAATSLIPELPKLGKEKPSGTIDVGGKEVTVEKGKTEINGTKHKVKYINDKRYRKQIDKEIRRVWNSHKKTQEHWNKRGGYEAFRKEYAKNRYNYNW